jgi:hypothetical protein
MQILQQLSFKRVLEPFQAEEIKTLPPKPFKLKKSPKKKKVN